MTTTRPYPAYKPSGIEWLGDVPAHWEVTRLKGCVTNITDLTREQLDDELYLALEHVESWTGRVNGAGDGVSFSGQVKRFQAKDVLFGKLRPYLAKVTCPKRSGVCVGEFLVLRPHDAHLSPFYLEQLLRSKPVIDAIDSSTFGAKMPRADWQFIGDLLFPLPPIAEQRAIVKYLDHADARIRRYIDAKQKLIALLEEERQALISRAVTRGIDHNVRLRPSGVEWLGDVPAHWEVRRLKTACRFAYGDTLTTDMRRIGNVPVYGSNGRVGIHSSANTKAPCVVIGRKGSFGKVNFVMRPIFAIDTTFFIDERYSSNNLRWIFYLLGCLGLDAVTKDSAIPGLGREDAYKQIVPLPPLAEQRAIVKYLDRATGDIDTAIARARRQVELLQEYRARLIADVVTGKLDAREAAEWRPEESESPAGDIEKRSEHIYADAES